jgi:hypothetical protein
MAPEQGISTFFRLGKERPDLGPRLAAPDGAIAPHGTILNECSGMMPVPIKPAAQEALARCWKECAIVRQNSSEELALHGADPGVLRRIDARLTAVPDIPVC